MSSGSQGWPRFSRPPEGLVLDGREHDGTLAVSERKRITRGQPGTPRHQRQTAIIAASRFPFPPSLQKPGNSNREVPRLSRFRDHQTACSCSNIPTTTPPTPVHREGFTTSQLILIGRSSSLREKVKHCTRADRGESEQKLLTPGPPHSGLIRSGAPRIRCNELPEDIVFASGQIGRNVPRLIVAGMPSGD